MINQRYSQDCGVACLAMMLKLSYEKTENQVYDVTKKRFIHHGMNIEQIALVLDSMLIEPAIIRTLIPGVPSILCVPSLGTKKAFHYVYFDGRNIFDPSNYDIYVTSDFFNDMPMSDGIVFKIDLKDYNLPSHLYNEFDFEYIKGNL